MSRIESGKVVLAEDISDVREYFDSTVTIVTADVNAKGLKLEKSIENIRHPKVITDISRMNQIVINIIGNAVKYTPEGGTIRFSITELDSNEPEYGLYKIIVADNGIGMSKEFLSKIFDEFSRENTSTVSRIQGTGLGMSIVKRLVDLMNGTINVNSEKGKGTTITLLIPLKICGDAMADDEPEEAKIAEAERLLESAKTKFKDEYLDDAYMNIQEINKIYPALPGKEEVENKILYEKDLLKRYNDAFELLENNEFDKALKVFKEAYNYKPKKFAEAPYYLGRCYLLKDEPDKEQALKNFEIALANPDLNDEARRDILWTKI